MSPFAKHALSLLAILAVSACATTPEPLRGVVLKAPPELVEPVDTGNVVGPVIEPEVLVEGTGGFFSRIFSGFQREDPVSDPFATIPDNITATRAFSPEEGGYNAEDFAGFGLVHFRTPFTADNLETFIRFCRAFRNTLPKGITAQGEAVSIPKNAQMITVWPVEDGASEKITQAIFAERAAAVSGDRDSMQEAADTICLQAATGYRQDETITSDPSGLAAEMKGDGPFLIAWAPGAAKGQPGQRALFVDLSEAKTQAQADEAFRHWRDLIEGDQALWGPDAEPETVRGLIIAWANKRGPTVLKLVGLA